VCGPDQIKDQVRAQYRVDVTDKRMPSDSGGTARAGLVAWVFNSSGQATRCYKSLHQSLYTKVVHVDATHSKIVKVTPKRISDDTLMVDPADPTRPGALPGRTGEFYTLVVSGRTLIFGISFNGPDARLIEGDARTTRSVIGS
jgi:hypothetical protein